MAEALARALSLLREAAESEGAYASVDPRDVVYASARDDGAVIVLRTGLRIVVERHGDRYIIATEPPCQCG